MYFVGIWLVAFIYEKKIDENGWSVECDGDGGSVLPIIVDTLLISCCPVLRVLYIVMMAIMSAFTQEAVYNWMDDIDKRL
jgi:hypothetical protein